ncbi:hypothetical protein IWW52_003198, partial [Coemansia sp. RSA 2704]
RTPENVVSVVRDDAQPTLVHQFVGHTSTVLGAEWRSHAGAGGGRPRHQLITWGRDQVLRMWTASERVVDAVGSALNRAPRVVKSHFDELPSFATNFLRPHELLHLYDQRTLPTELLLAASSSDRANITTWHELSRTSETKALQLRMSSSEDFAEAPMAQRAGVHAAWTRPMSKAAARASTTDEHSSDDDEDEEEARGAKQTGDSSVWMDELDAAVQKYRPSKAASLKHLSSESRTCEIVVGVPWITRDTATLSLSFPARYPLAAAKVGVDALGTAFGARATIADKLEEVAGTCAAQGVGAVDHCLYALLTALIAGARAKKLHKGQGRASAEDLERLPLPPTPLDEVGGQRRHPGSAQVEARLYSAPFAAERGRSGSLRHGDARWVPASYTSEENVSAASYGEAEYSDDQASARFGKDDDSRYSDNDGDEDEDDDDDEEYYRLGYDDDMDLYNSDSPSEMPVAALDGIPRSLRHASNRERFDSHIPFPRLCGGVFSGPGQLVCFFASIYALDKFPEQGAAAGATAQGAAAAAAARERSREDMVQQLRIQIKPRNYRKLEYYQNMVQFGSQNKGPYGAGDAVQLANGRGFGDSDEEADHDEAQDEEVPRYYFRQQISRTTISAEGSDPSEYKTYFRPMTISCPDTGIGNIALICNVSVDRSADLDLARQFVLTGPSTDWICRHNARVSALNNRQELAHVWSLLACLLGPVTLDADTSDGGGIEVRHSLWISHPPVLNWLYKIMAHYERRGDVQTLALLACVLSKALDEAAAARVAGRAAYSSTAAPAAQDLPPWMKATGGKKHRMATLSRSSCPPNAAAPGSDAQRNVSFRLPSSSTSSLSPSVAAAAAAAAATASSLGLLSESQLLRGMAAGRPGSLSDRPGTPPLQLPSQPQPPTAVALALSTDELRPGVYRAGASQSTEGTTPVASGMATHVQASDSEPPSPEILKELDSDEIKQNEIMMMAETKAPSPEPDQLQHFKTQPAAIDVEALDGSEPRRTSSEQLPGTGASPAGPEAGENLWRRLRSNVLSRVHTVGGYGGNGTKDGDAAAAAVQVSTAADAQQPTPAGLSATAGTPATAVDSHITSARSGAAAAAAETAHRWAQHSASREANSAAAQALQRELLYTRIKRDFGRLHTRMVVHAHDTGIDETPAAARLRAQAAYLDHWKLLYARILYKWEMDEKAVEVLKCLQDDELRELYNGMNCQPSVPRHDNLTRTGNPVIAVQTTASQKRSRADAHDSSGNNSSGPAERPKSQRRQSLEPTPAEPDTASGSIELEPTGAPWLSCTWCHEYVHGRALICHACGHGGHHDHMQRWFHIVRKQLLRSGLTPAQYAACSSGSSSTSNLLRRGLTPAHRVADGESADALASAVPSVVTATDVVRSLANSPYMVGVDPAVLASPAERLPLLADMSLSDSHDSDSALRHSTGALQMRMHRPSALSRQLSRETLDSSDLSARTSDSDDDDLVPMPSDTGSVPLSLGSLPGRLRSAVDSSDGESNERLRPAQRMMLRSELRADREPDELLDLEHQYDEGAALLQRGIPTCPSGCGCNCLYESYKLIIE